MSEFLEPFLASGLMMQLVALCLVIELVIIIRRSRDLMRASMNEQPFVDRVRGRVLAGDLPGAIELSSEKPDAVLAQVVKAGLTSADQPPTHIRAIVHEAASEALPGLSQKLPALRGLALVALLLGVYGVIVELFPRFINYGWPIDPLYVRVLTSLSGSMAPAIAGLAVALVAVVGHALLSAWARKLEAQIDYGSTMVINLLALRDQGPTR